MKPKKVLIVDDEEGFRVLARIFLMRLGILVYEAKDGLDGYAIARQIHPDLIITDIMLPRMDGVEFIKSIRTSVLAEIKDCPIIAVSGADPEMQKAAVEVGANTLLEKPIRQSTLRQTVQVFLDIQDKPDV